jgi:hypothetical protein
MAAAQGARGRAASPDAVLRQGEAHLETDDVIAVAIQHLEAPTSARDDG